MTVTWPQIEALKPCANALAWGRKVYGKKQSIRADVLIKAVMRQEFTWANWLLVRLLTREQQIQYAIYAAEQVLGIYEKKYPGDVRPRKAIEAARAYLKEPTVENKAKVRADAAADAADAAADAAYAAAAAANAAANAAAARQQMQRTILTYGLSLLSSPLPAAR